MSRIKPLVVGSFVAVVALSTNVALAKPLSEKQWRKQGNAICKQVNDGVNEVASQVFAGLGQNDAPTAEQAATFVDQAGPVFEQGLTALDALNEPKSLTKGVAKFEAAVTDALTALRSDPSALTTSKDPFAKANKIARKIGLKVCAS